jgi:hypothetical protein
MEKRKGHFQSERPYNSGSVTENNLGKLCMIIQGILICYEDQICPNYCLTPDIKSTQINIYFTVWIPF